MGYVEKLPDDDKTPIMEEDIAALSAEWIEVYKEPKRITRPFFRPKDDLIWGARVHIWSRTTDIHSTT